MIRERVVRTAAQPGPKIGFPVNRTTGLIIGYPRSCNKINLNFLALDGNLPFFKL